MRNAPSIVPHEADQDTYLVLEDFGHLGCSWRETDVDDADRETLIRDLVEVSTGTRSALWLSTRPKAGPEMSPKMSPMSYGGDTSNWTRYRTRSSNLSRHTGADLPARPSTPGGCFL